MSESEFPNELFLCHHCGSMCKGEKGLGIHLSKSAGDEFHPVDASTDQDEFTKVPANQEWEPVADNEELAKLHTEIMSKNQDMDLYRPEGGDDQDDQELDELIEQAVVPIRKSKTEQVAALLNQVPELYDNADRVKEEISCSTTTFYEGRKLHESGVDLSVQKIPNQTTGSFDDVDTVTIDGKKYVSFDVFQEFVKEINESNQQLTEIANRGTKIIHRHR